MGKESLENISKFPRLYYFMAIVSILLGGYALWISLFSPKVGSIFGLFLGLLIVVFSIFTQLQKNFGRIILSVLLFALTLWFSIFGILLGFYGLARFIVISYYLLPSVFAIVTAFYFLFNKKVKEAFKK